MLAHVQPAIKYLYVVGLQAVAKAKRSSGVPCHTEVESGPEIVEYPQHEISVKVSIDCEALCRAMCCQLDLTC